MYKKLTFTILMLMTTSFACALPTYIPVVKTPVSDITEKISVNAPEGDEVNLNLSFGAGELTITPGARTLVEGTAIYNLADLKPEISTQENTVNISQSEYQASDFPALVEKKNRWNLQFGSTPMNLTINAGAYKGNIDLGGLGLRNLNISDGASEVKLDFSAPNTEKMSFFSYKTGASNVNIQNLANANFSTFQFDSGAGNYTLDFGGTLQRDGSTVIQSGVSNLTLVIPARLNATVKVEGGLSNIHFPDSWEKNGNIYTQSGIGPAMTIIIEMGVGNVQVTD